MDAASLTRRPPRCTLANIDTAETFECQFNPAGFSERLGVGWARETVPGLAFEPLNYQNTKNRAVGGVEFFLDRLVQSETDEETDILSFRSFLRSLTAPPDKPGDPFGAPPRVLFVWPKTLTFEAVVAAVDFKYQAFAIDGALLRYTARVDFEELLEVRLTSEELRGQR